MYRSLSLLLLTGCLSATEPEPCQPAVVMVVETDSVAVSTGMGCVHVVQWYRDAAPAR